MVNRARAVLGGAGVRGEVARFLPVGFSAVAVDFVVYRGLLLLSLPIAVSKAISFIAGAVFAYFANRAFTFRVDSEWHRNELLRFASVYGFAMVANVGVNSVVVLLAGRGEVGLGLAFLAATAVSATLNFTGMKLIVFRRHGAEP